MRDLELLAPARNKAIGIAAIDCGADAVYIAGEEFGARQAAGNSAADIAELCRYAHRFGARVFVTVNTILYDSELDEARRLLKEIVSVGADALIVQDMAVLTLCRELGLEVALHASTQCAVRTPEKAAFLASLGFSRIILERQLPLEKVRGISAATGGAEIEFFVHGALCTGYSGQCYLSECITGRSANRGACAQACRSRYDLLDGSGKTLIKDKAVLSLKDYCLVGRLEDLASAGVSSFKIEGRLKNESYVRNVVRAYSRALDDLVAANPESYRRASFGRVVKSFEPLLEKTFNRGYTELFLDGKKGNWTSMDSAKGMGERIGTVKTLSSDKSSMVLSATSPDVVLSNGDGLAFVAKNGDTVGFRADVCEGLRIRFRPVPELFPGAVIYRNLDTAFEKEIAANPGLRLLDVKVSVDISEGEVAAEAGSEDGRKVRLVRAFEAEPAGNVPRMEAMIRSQIEKTASIYSFCLSSLTYDVMPFLPASFLNGLRRDLAEGLDSLDTIARPLAGPADISKEVCREPLTYKANVSNRLSKAFYEGLGAEVAEGAYELTHRQGAELMRTKYCVRHELGLCPKQSSGAVHPDPLFLLNNGRRFRLDFDCRSCEMTVSGD